MAKIFFRYVGIASLLFLIACAPLKIQTEVLNPGYLGKEYSMTLDVTGAIGSLSWSVEGDLPPGIEFDPSVQKLHGVPSGIGEFTFSLTATDSAPKPQTTTKQFTLVVDELLTFYVAPGATGMGSGASREDAASYRSTALWNQVQVELENQPVRVLFLDGDYLLILNT